MKTYQEALERLGSRESRKIGNNTYLQKRENGIAVKLHETDVVTYLPSGDTILNSGGWKTATTKDRINSYSPKIIHQKNGLWYMGRWHEPENFLFQDGIIIKENGSIENGLSVETVKDQLKLKRRVKRYVEGYVKALLEGKVPKPDNGDCWDCLMVTEDGKTLGEVTKSDHLLTHIEEKYYVPSLLMHLVNKGRFCLFGKAALYKLWNEEGALTDWEKRILTRDAKSTLNKYMQNQLGFAK